LEQVPVDPALENYQYDDTPYRNRVYRGFGHPQPELPLVFGPNIADWPAQIPLPENLLLTVAAAIYDPVTTTDELIPSGETSSYRSNPLRLSEYALSRRDPGYVGRAKEIQKAELLRQKNPHDPAIRDALAGYDPVATGLGSLLLALRPGDGSAREQAASCQRVLGGGATLAEEYPTKRSRSNVINWGMLPFVLPGLASMHIETGDRIYVPGVRTAMFG
jgi:aconitate hydratase